MSTQILETYRALIQAVSAESSPYQEELLSALSALESRLQAHATQAWSPAERIMSGAFHPVVGASDEAAAAN